MTKALPTSSNMSLLLASRQPALSLKNRTTSFVNFYKEQGIPVLTLPSEERFTKIRAILHADGDGTVEFGEAIDSVAHRAEAEVMYNSWAEMLKFQACPAAFSSADAYPIQRIAKFWFANGLGSLPVFPVPLATAALDHAIRYWISNSQAFAFALPVRQGRGTKKQLNTYGSRLARGIFRGGGPFMLEDSSDLVVHFLHKLGYLDDTWNSDFTEALSCFWNASGCKMQLRKLGVQLDTHETTARAAAKLRTAVLSDSCNGQWQPARGHIHASWALNLQRWMKFMGCPGWPSMPWQIWQRPFSNMLIKRIPSEEERLK